MKQKTIIFVFFILLNICYSQKEYNIWQFGKNCGLNFNTLTGSPITFHQNKTFGNQGCTISDSTGNILFYSEGIGIYNKNRAYFKNAIIGRNNTSQPCVILHHIENDSLYFVIFNSDTSSTHSDGTVLPAILSCQIINKNLNNGLGGLLPIKTYLLDSSTFKLSAVNHSNGKDIWILSHQWNSDAFYAFLLTSTGIDTTPIITHIGSFHSGGFIHPTFNTRRNLNLDGMMKFSPDGKKVALTISDTGFIELFDFDNTTGKLSNPISFQYLDSSSSNGIEFSPDSRKIYVVIDYYSYKSIVQYDISSYNLVDIKSSAFKLFDSSEHIPVGSLQLAPDGKIYCSIENDTCAAYISYPNRKGKDCKFIRYGIPFIEYGDHTVFGLQSLNQSYVQSKCSGELSFDFPNFSDTKNLSLVSECRNEGNSLRLTPTLTNVKGAAWTKQTINVTNGFETEFSFRFSQGKNGGLDDGSLPGADGIAFVIQNAANNAIGTTGGGIGYDGIPNSLAIEIDTYMNFKSDDAGKNDPNGNHISVQSMGKAANTSNHDSIATLVMKDIPFILRSDSTVYNIKIIYTNQTLKIFIDSTLNYTTPVISINNIDFSKILNLDNNKAYVGFTSSTGNNVEIHDILNWNFCEYIIPQKTGVPAKFDIEFSNDNIIIIPNPANKNITIKINNNQSINKIDIINLLGIKVKEFYSEEQSTIINIEDLSNGVYFLRIGNKTKMFIKN